ncbi:MAG: tetratricopeptide repeat-containing serine protease family protein [Pseudomonadota bacterium]
MTKLMTLMLVSLVCLAAPVYAGPLEDSKVAYDRQDYETALKLIIPLAEQGIARAQYGLGIMYYRGHGVPPDYKKAIFWFTKAAEQGATPAQRNLGIMYHNGQGVSKNYILAYMWTNLAAAGGDEGAKRELAPLERKMNPEQIAEAQRLSANFRNGAAGTAPIPRPATEATQSVPNTVTKAPRLKGTGTGFVVSEQGHVLTNLHVVRGAREIRVASQDQPVTVLASDPANDLALLKIPTGSYKPARFRVGPPLRAGETVVVVGYPLQGLLTTAPSVTSGTLSALSGPGDNRRVLQITAPVQPGNSGSPLFDESGLVIGVVVGKLDAIKVAKSTGDLPQNVNFSIHGAMAKAFLETQGVVYHTGSSGSALKTADIAEQASKSVVLIGCYE